MTANEDLRDRQISHSVGLSRLAAGVARKLVDVLGLSRSSVAAAIFAFLDKAERRGIDPRGAGTLGLYRELDGVLNEVIAGPYKIFRSDSREELTAIAAYEADFQRRLYTATAPVVVSFSRPSQSLIARIVNTVPFQGHAMAEWFNLLEWAAQRRIAEAVRIGFMEGENNTQIVRRIVGTRANGYRDGVHGISRRKAFTWVRTAVSHATASARTAFFTANAEHLVGVQLLATLDGRTTPICRSRDGNVYKLGDEPSLPFHFGERSTYVGYLSDNIVIDRPFVRDTRTRRLREIDFRAQARDRVGAARWKNLSPAQRRVEIRNFRENFKRLNIGQVPSSTTYGEWLRRQPAAFQDEALGRSKGILFRKGQLPIDRFVDDQGRSLTLAQLMESEPAAWRKAGLSL